MRLVAIGADDPRALHAALREAAPFEDFALHLAIGVILAACQQQRGVGVEEARAGQGIGHQWTRAGMAGRAGSHTGCGGLAWRPFPRRDAARIARSEAPGAAGAVAERHLQPEIRHLRQRAGARPGDMPGATAVAGFAADRDLGPARVVAVPSRLIAAHQPGRMAGRAHEIPPLVAPGPVQRIAGAGQRIRHQVKPALPAFRGRAAIPGPGQRLPPAIGEQHQILLQGIEAEGLGDGELGLGAVRAIGPHDEAVAVAAEDGAAAPLRHAASVEGAEHAGRRRCLHCAGVVAGLPLGVLCGVAGGAGGGADEAGARRLSRRRGEAGGQEQGQQHGKPRCRHRDQQAAQRDPERPS